MAGAWPLILAALLFLAASLLLLPLVGLQADEALFSSPLYGQTNQEYSAGYGRFTIPLMLMSYLGTLKTALYAPLLAILGANVWTIRLPMVLAGLLTLFLFYRLSLQIIGRAGAGAAVLILATDPLFVMTNTFDWGPVALDHLLLVTGCWAIVGFARRAFQNASHSDPSAPSGAPFWHDRLAASAAENGGHRWSGPALFRVARRISTRPEAWLALGCFCFGLALWNKAIFSWELVGLGVATLLVLPGTLRRLFTVRHLATAAVAFFAGASPLLLYNLRNDFVTFRQNAQLSAAEIPAKWVHLEGALQGNSLFGYIAREEWEEPPKPVSGAIHRVSAGIRDLLGERRNSGFYYALGGLLLLGLPWWWRSRTAWFALVFSAAAWLIMAATHDAGGSAHHVVLLWPFPVLLAAAILARFPRSVLVPATVAIVALNLSVDNQYFYQLKTNGTGVSFTDAIFPLSESFIDPLSGAPGETLYVTDWGIYDSLALLHRGRITLRVATDFALPKPSPQQLEELQRILHDPQALFIGHVDGQEFFQGSRANLLRLAAEAGLAPELVRTIADSNGRPMFEVYRLQAAVEPAA